MRFWTPRVRRPRTPRAGCSAPGGKGRLAPLPPDPPKRGARRPPRGRGTRPPDARARAPSPRAPSRLRAAGGAAGAGRRLCPEPFLVPKPPVKTGSDEAEFALPLQRATFLFSFCHSSLGISTCGRLPCSLPVPAALDVLGVHNAAPRGHRQGGHRMARRLPQAHGNRSG